jgi:hypothetical protein
MFGDVQTIKAGRVGGLSETQSFVEQGRERPVAMLDVSKSPIFMMPR